ncbi:aminopeptidase N-like [Lineus longissimus]|uniref:aminopeptidase N-like n=1 Tax=Lineus longissimus TaxID=88925 RepID=UPI002B4F64AA
MRYQLSFLNRPFQGYGMLLLVKSILLLASAVCASGQYTDEELSPRLPRTFLPYHYDLEVQPDIYGEDESEFYNHGRVTIHIYCNQSSDLLIFHVRDLNIQEVLFGNEGGYSKKPELVRWETDSRRDFFIGHLSEPAEEGVRYFIILKFSSHMKLNLKGIYFSKYKVSQYKTGYVAATNMAPTYARRAFPCFDEPSFKASFRISVLRKSSHVSISNMGLADTGERHDGWIQDRFEKTPIMSTYLVAVVVAEYSYAKTKTKRGTTIRVWARPGELHKTGLALHRSKQILENMEDYLGVPYEINKIDHVPIPDFLYGAMENWGLVTYAEPSLLFDPHKEDTATKNGVLYILGHEIAHQWFGNLVTMKWWNDLWLKEGFSEFVAAMVLPGVDRDFSEDKQVFKQRRYAGMKDSFRSSHPMDHPNINYARDVRLVYDSITYNKGGLVIKMLHFILGDATFKEAVRLYLRKFAHSSADLQDLIKVLEQIIGKYGDRNGSRKLDIGHVLSTWVNQMGYPLVTITRQGRRAHALQTRFLLDPEKTSVRHFDTEHDYKWEIPLTFTTNATYKCKPDKIFWMHKKNVTLGKMHGVSAYPQDWILANVGMNTFYRVNYDNNNWQSLAEQLDRDYSAIPYINRAQLIDDSITLARAGQLDMVYAFRICKFLRHERDSLPWNIFLTDTQYMRNMLRFSPSYRDFRSYMLRLLGPAYKEASWSLDPNPQKSQWSLDIIKYSCRYEYGPCLRKATQLYDNRHILSIPKDLRRVVLCATISHGGGDRWNKVYQEYKASLEKDGNVDADYLAALACSRQPWVLSRLLARSLNVSEVPPDATRIVFQEVAKNPVGVSLALDTLLINWEYFKNKKDKSYVLQTMRDTLNGKENLISIEDFLASNPDLGNSKWEFDLLLEALQTNLRWMEKNEPKISDWLKRV